MHESPSIFRNWVERAFGTERRPVSVRLDEWATPDFGDDVGSLRAGKILEWMDVIGPLAASRHCQIPVATVSVDRLALRRPIRVGQHVTLRAMVAFTSIRSVGVTLAIDADGALAASGWMTLVAVRDGRVQSVPQIRPRSMSERTHFREGRMRRDHHRGDANNVVMPTWDDVATKASFVHKIEPIRGSKLNFHGTLYGGTLMRWMETAANLSARAHLGASVRFCRLLGLAFVQPIPPHVFVHIRSLAIRAGNGTIDVFVNAQAEDPGDGTKTDAVCAFVSYAPAVHQPIPSLLGDTETERALAEQLERRVGFERSLHVVGPRHR
jgi:acyl-CoA hydrolase